MLVKCTLPGHSFYEHTRGCPLCIAIATSLDWALNRYAATLGKLATAEAAERVRAEPCADRDGTGLSNPVYICSYCHGPLDLSLPHRNGMHAYAFDNHDSCVDIVDFRNRQRAVEAARLDADKSAQPKTRLLSHVAVPDDGQTHNVVAGPATVVEDVESGKRTALHDMNRPVEPDLFSGAGPCRTCGLIMAEVSCAEQVIAKMTRALKMAECALELMVEHLSDCEKQKSASVGEGCLNSIAVVGASSAVREVLGKDPYGIPEKEEQPPLAPNIALAIATARAEGERAGRKACARELKKEEQHLWVIQLIEKWSNKP